MYKEVQVRVHPSEAADERRLISAAARDLQVAPERIRQVDVIRRSIDARRREVMLNLTLGVHIDRVEEAERVFVPAYRDVSGGEPVIVVGAGPAGLFAALRLIERGFRPIILERGKAVGGEKKGFEPFI